jgi:Protein of unknown function (DUF3800)
METRTHIYIDEAGDLTPISKGGKPMFLFGCIITDDPITLNKRIAELKEDIKNSAYHFGRDTGDFEKKGFHASTNHPDIYGRFVELLNTLNFRAYVVLVDKTSPKFSDAIKQHSNFNSFILKTLLKDRLLKRKDKKIHIVLEQSLGKKNLEKSKLDFLIKDINSSLLKEGLITNSIDVTTDIQGKNEDAGIDVVDYVNNIIFNNTKVGSKKVGFFNKIILNYFKIIKSDDKSKRNRHNLVLIEPKVALVYDFLKGSYFGGRKETSTLSEFLSSV